MLSITRGAVRWDLGLGEGAKHAGPRVARSKGVSETASLEMLQERPEIKTAKRLGVVDVCQQLSTCRGVRDRQIDHVPKLVEGAVPVIDANPTAARGTARVLEATRAEVLPERGLADLG